MVDRWLTATLAVATIALAGCGEDNGGEVRTVTVSAVEPSAGQETVGDPILIETRISNAKRHAGVVLSGSVIGESAFCRGGTVSGGGAFSIVETFSCRDGSLKVRFAPTQHSLVQSAVWEVVSGTGSYNGLRGGGSMVARFEDEDPDKGRETFTGTVGQ